MKGKESITLGFNREFARQYGVTAALVYQEVYRKYFYWKEQGQLVDGFFWCDQIAMAEWLLISRQTLSRVIKLLKDEGLIETETHYKPGTSETTTWWKIPEWDSQVTSNVTSCEVPHDEASHIKADSKAGSAEGSPIVVFLRVNPSGKAWKSQRVYSTQEEVDRLEESDPDDTVDFKYWKSPKMVGDDARAKFKRTKAKLIQPDVQEEPDEINQIEGLENYMKFGDM